MRNRARIILMQPKDDIFRSPAETLVVPVNRVGVMGNGLALAYKQRWPGLFGPYAKHCRHWDCRLYMAVFSDKSLLCFATKNHFHDPSKIEYIEEGLDEFIAKYKNYGINYIAFPALGCGKGQLSWPKVLDVMMKKFKTIEDPDLTIMIYPPRDW